MDWKLIILLSSFGIIMGLLSVKGFTQKLEPFLWILFAIISALVISKNISGKTFLHAFIVGICWGVFNALCQHFFFEKYMANNLPLRENFNKITFIQPKYFVLITGPLIGLITGAVLGGLSLLVKKIW